MDRKTVREAPSPAGGVAARPGPDGQAVPARESWPAQADHPEPRSRLRITVTRSPATLHLTGEIDESTVGMLTRALTAARWNGDCPIHVDLSGVEFCDLAGLRALIFQADGRVSGLSGAGEVTLVNLPAQLAALLRILGWDAAPGLTLAEPELLAEPGL